MRFSKIGAMQVSKALPFLGATFSLGFSLEGGALEGGAPPISTKEGVTHAKVVPAWKSAPDLSRDCD